MIQTAAARNLKNSQMLCMLKIYIMHADQAYNYHNARSWSLPSDRVAHYMNNILNLNFMCESYFNSRQGGLLQYIQEWGEESHLTLRYTLCRYPLRSMPPTALPSVQGHDMTKKLLCFSNTYPDSPHCLLPWVISTSCKLEQDFLHPDRLLSF